MIVEGLPGCTGDELFNYGVNTLQGKQAALPLCRPPDQLLDLTNQLIDSMLRGAMIVVPDQVDLAGALAWQHTIPVTEFDLQQAPSMPWATYRLFRMAGPWLPFASVLFFILALVFGNFTSRGSLFWGGFSLAFPGLAGLLITLAGAFWVGQIVPAVIGRLFLANLAIFNLIERILLAVSNQFLLLLGEISLGMALLGIAMAAVGVWYTRKDAV